MPTFSTERLRAYCAETFRTAPGLRLFTPQEAVEFVHQRGFIFFWPNKEINFPSLWAAVAGDRPVADEHDDPGHVTWSWKDSLLGQKRWYYGRVLRHRNAMISLDVLPYFYALSPNLGDPEQDYLVDYQEGKLTAEAKSIFEALLREGPLDTIALRKSARLASSASDTRFNKALNDLQMEFKVLPIGISEAGAWNYAFIYELTHRHFPTLIDQAGLIFENEARQNLSMQFFESVGAAPLTQVSRLFGWKYDDTCKAVASLISSSRLVSAPLCEKNEQWIGLPDLLDETIN